MDGLHRRTLHRLGLRPLGSKDSDFRIVRRTMGEMKERMVRGDLYSVVGADAVVTRDLPAGVVAMGVPARALREIGEQDRIEIPSA